MATALRRARLLGGYGALLWSASIRENQPLLKGTSHLHSIDTLNPHPAFEHDRGSFTCAAKAISLLGSSLLALGFSREACLAEDLDPDEEDQPETKSNIHTVKWRIFTDRARILFSKGSFDEAERLFYRALEEAKEGFGDDDPHVASCYNNLAELFRMRREYDKAEPLYLEAIDRLQRSLGPEHGSVGFALHNLAGFYLLQKKLDQAQACYERALAVKRRALGLDHPEYANTMFNLGEVVRLRGNLDQALDLIRESIRILENIGLGSTTIAVKRMSHLSELLALSGQLAEAEALQKKIVQIVEMSTDFNFVDIVNALESLVTTLHRQGKLDECERQLERCVDLLSSNYGDNNIRLAASLSKLGGIIFQRGKGIMSAEKASGLEQLEKAEGLLVKAVKIAELQWKDVRKQKLANLHTAKQKIPVPVKTYPLLLIQSLVMLGVVRIHKLELITDKYPVKLEKEAEQALQYALSLLEEEQVKQLLGQSLEAKKLYDDCSHYLTELWKRRNANLGTV